MTLQTQSDTFGLRTIPRRRHAVVVVAAAAIGVFAALGVLVFVGALLVSGVVGISVFEADNLERLATSTVIAAVALVFVAFFCGGWTYGVLRGGATRRSESTWDGQSNAYAPTRRAITSLGRGTTAMDGSFPRLLTREHRFGSRVKRSLRKLTYADLDTGRFDELVGKLR